MPVPFTSMPLKAVFFDAGETILSPHPSFHELFAEELAERDVFVDPQDVLDAFEAIAPTFAEVLERLGTTEWTTSKEVSRAFWGGVYGAAFSHLGVEDPDAALADSLYRRFTRFESYRLFPDVVSTISWLKDAGLVVGLISNFEEWLEGMLIEMEIAPLFDVMVISGKEGVEKPDPRIFQVALERSGVAAKEAMYVGDNPRLDAEASTSVGMIGVLIDRKGRHVGFEGHRVRMLDELIPLVKSLSGSEGPSAD